MTLVFLLAITMMWFPLGLFFLGTGDAKTCGAMTLSVGALIILGGFVEGFVPPGNLWDAAILIAFGLLYLVVAHALLWGIENMKSVGNASLMLAFICVMYAIAYAHGYHGLVKVEPTPYLAFVFGTFVVLLTAVWANTYGWVPPKVVGALLVVLNFISLAVPAFGLMLFNRLPF
jgi:putative amide transporter protein